MTLPFPIGDLRVPAVDKRRLGPALITVAAVAIAVAFSRGATFEQRLLLAGIAVGLLTPTAVILAARRFDLFSPQTIFAAAFGVMFLARPVAMLWTNNFSWGIADSPPVTVGPGFTTMLLAAFLGTIAFQLGYFYRRPARTLRPAPKIDWGSGFLFRCALVIGSLGTLLFGAFVLQAYRHHGLSALFGGRSRSQTSLYQSSTAYLYDGMFLLAPATLLLVGSVVFGRGKRRRLAAALAGGFGLLLVISTLPSGNRTALLLLLGALFVFYFLARRKRPALVLSLVVILVGFFAVSVLRDTRTASIRQQGLAHGVLSAFESPGEQVKLLFQGGDTSMAPAFALETQVVPAGLGYRYGGATVGDLVIRPIPHILWKGKPLAPEAALTKRLWGAAYAAGVAHPVYSVMGTFYFDFGLLGVVAGMLFVGVAFGLVDARLLRTRDEGLIVVLAAILPLLVVGLRQSLPDTVFHFAFTVVPLVLALELTRRRVASETG
jgi:hypothetical protein